MRVPSFKSFRDRERTLAHESFGVDVEALLSDCIRMKLPVMLAFPHLLDFEGRYNASPCDVCVMQDYDSVAQILLRRYLSLR